MFGQLQKLVQNLAALGPKRLIALLATGLIVFSITGLAGYYLSRPQFELLYSGLDRTDTSRIGEVLKDANISFDISADGTSVSVHYGETAKARMLLAEKGLPQSANTGYDLFDHMGSLGLTSFMQEITRVRALEGELSRTIMTMKGVKQARVHLVIPEDSLFKKNKKNATASVVLRLENADSGHIANAVRNLVAAATPAMTSENVVVMTTDGKVISSSGTEGDVNTNKAFKLEHELSKNLEENIKKTLSPYLALNNFQVSVVTKVNADSQQINEKIYNPDSKVERSVRVIKENNTAQNSTSQSPASVTSNLPNNKQAQDGKQTNEENQKREEITNFEISERSVETLTNGYAIERISAAILINRKSLADAGFLDKNNEIDTKKLQDLNLLIMSAIGIKESRGDTLKISVVDFSPQSAEAPVIIPETYYLELIKQSGTVFNGFIIIIAVLLGLRFGFLPIANRIIDAFETRKNSELLLNNTESGQELIESSNLSQMLQEKNKNVEFNDLLLPKNETQEKLEKIVSFNEEQAASILKQWIRESATLT